MFILLLLGYDCASSALRSVPPISTCKMPGDHSTCRTRKTPPSQNERQSNKLVLVGISLPDINGSNTRCIEIHVALVAVYNLSSLL